MIICPDDAPGPDSPNIMNYTVEKLEEILMYSGVTGVRSLYEL